MSGKSWLLPGAGCDGVPHRVAGQGLASQSPSHHPSRDQGGLEARPGPRGVRGWGSAGLKWSPGPWAGWWDAQERLAGTVRDVSALMALTVCTCSKRRKVL